MQQLHSVIMAAEVVDCDEAIENMRFTELCTFGVILDRTLQM